jgi:hypothetical protein
MDTLQTYIDALDGSSRGKEVKKSLIDILNFANNMTGDADTLEFHGAGYYLSKEDCDDLNAIIQWIRKNMRGLNGEFFGNDYQRHIYEGSFVPWET